MKKTLLTAFLIVSSCFFVSAQFTGRTNTGSLGLATGGIVSFITLAQTVVSKLVPFLVGLGMLAFFWFLVLFIWKGNESPDAQSKAKSGMFWSILALFVMVSIWGIIGVIGSMFGISQGGTMPGFKLPGEN